MKMKKMLVFLLMISFSCFASEVRLIDTKGLLKELNSKLSTKSLEDFYKGDSAIILTQGVLKRLEVKKANHKSVSLKGAQKIKITAEEFRQAKNNMMNIVLKDSDVKVSVNGQVFVNTYVVHSVSPITHILDDGTQIPASLIKISTPDTGNTFFGMGPAVRMNFVISTETPAIAQLLKAELNGIQIYDLRSYDSIE